MRKFGIGLALVSLVLLAGCNSSPQDRRDQFLWIADFMLNLSDSQEAELAEVADEVMAVRTQTLKMRLEKAQHLQNLLLSEKMDPEELSKLADAHWVIIQQHQQQLSTRVARFHQSLTPEQKAKANELLQEFITEQAQDVGLINED